MIFITQRSHKNDAQFASIHSPNQEVPEYLQKYALILHVQKLYRALPANNTRHDFVVLVQFDLADTYFYSMQFNIEGYHTFRLDRN